MQETQNDMMQGILVRYFGGFYIAADETGTEYTLRCKKKFRHQRISPLVGDRVMFTPGTGEEEGWVEEILPRTSESVRPPVANVTLMMITICPVPEPDLMLVDRLMVRARKQGMKILLVVTKADLDDEALADRMRRQYRGAECDVVCVCSSTGQGLEELRERMQGELCCLCGQSGVGKSTLLNALLQLELETGEISRKIQRGKNTTRHAELLMKDGLKVLDTAGFSLLELEGKTDPITLKESYPEFQEYEGCCRFEPCYHDHEPGCAVTAACADGLVDPDRLARYRELLQEVKKSWRERYD